MFNKNIWNAIGNKKRCSFKLNTKLETLCKNKYNVTGICNEFSCPLANSKYATIRTVDDKIYLFIKEPERTSTPISTYEKIELGFDYDEALKELETNLEFWDKEIIHKCKQKLTKIFEYFERRIKFEKEGVPILTHRKKKMNRREKVRALKALNTLNFEKDMSKELMLRLEEGIFGEELKEVHADTKQKAKIHKKKRFVTDLEESEEIEDNQINKKKSKKGKKEKKEKKSSKEINW